MKLIKSEKEKKSERTLNENELHANRMKKGRKTISMRNKNESYRKEKKNHSSKSKKKQKKHT